MTASDPVAAAVQAADARHWRAVRCLTIALLLCWAALGLGCGAFWADELNEHHLGGFPLGFWFAQQGAILGFVVLILVYALGMGWIDRCHRRAVQQAQANAGAPPERSA